MSQQPSSSQQNPNTPAHDWTQASDVDLEVHTSNSEGTEQAKETEKGRWEALRKEKWAEAHRQKAEEACLEREQQECEEQEKQEQEEHEAQERQAHEEQERQGALETAHWAAAVEVEAGVVSGQVGDHIQPDHWDKPWSHSGDTYALTVSLQGLQAAGGSGRVPDGAQEEEEAVAGGSRKWARTGGLRGSGRKKGWADEEDDNDKIKEVPGLVTSCPKASRLGLVREGSEFSRSGQGVPGPVYDEHMLVIHARQVVAMEHQVLMMEWMAGAMEAQAVTVCIYVQRQPVFLPWPPGGLAGAAPGASQVVVGGSRSSSRESGAAPAWGEVAVGGGVRESGEGGDQDTEGDTEGMQE
ncbi:hypothetical protein EDD16DRAFT_1714038 [Pisolithus croceorrhizus]|nr:hypothetical protein EDD16DRAFT_1714038 [Pisolithus croceorrhizus]